MTILMMMIMMNCACLILSGVRLQTVSLPVMKVTSCCFGGPDYSDLYVTSASLGLDQSERGLQPLAGDILRVRLRQQLTCLHFIHWLTCVNVWHRWHWLCMCVYRWQDLGLKVVLQTLSLDDLQKCWNSMQKVILTVSDCLQLINILAQYYCVNNNVFNCNIYLDLKFTKSFITLNEH